MTLTSGSALESEELVIEYLHELLSMLHPYIELQVRQSTWETIINITKLKLIKKSERHKGRLEDLKNINFLENGK